MTPILAGIGALGTFAVGRWLAQHTRPNSAMRILLLALSVAAGIPCLLFLAYYAHVLDNRAYFEWRAQPITDALPSLVGLPVGLLAADARRRVIFRGVVATLVLTSLAHAKPHLMPLAGRLQDSWQGGVCLQSTPATCGPCSAATVLRFLGMPASEAQIAAQAHTGATGTLNWLLVRALRDRGLQATYQHPGSLHEVRAPAIIGVRQGPIGHFIAYLGRNANGYVLGDPLVGPDTLSPAEFTRRYDFDHFAIEVAIRQ